MGLLYELIEDAKLGKVTGTLFSGITMQISRDKSYYVCNLNVSPDDTLKDITRGYIYYPNAQSYHTLITDNNSYKQSNVNFDFVIENHIMDLPVRFVINYTHEERYYIANTKYVNCVFTGFKSEFMPSMFFDNCIWT